MNAPCASITSVFYFASLSRFSRHDEPLPLYRSTSAVRQHTRTIEAPKPLSPKDNFFPISWRVIGGGVAIGTTRDSADVTDTDSVPSVPDSPLTPENRPLPSLEIKTNNPTQRKRSNSIPSTPSSSQVLVGNVSICNTLLECLLTYACSSSLPLSRLVFCRLFSTLRLGSAFCRGPPFVLLHGSYLSLVWTSSFTNASVTVSFNMEPYYAPPLGQTRQDIRTKHAGLKYSAFRMGLTWCQPAPPIP